MKASANSRELIFTYSLAVPAGQTRGLIHWILQRNLPEVSQDVAAIAPFLQRGQLVVPAVEAKLTEAVVNFPAAAFAVEVSLPAKLRSLVALNDLTARIGLYRRSEDLLRAGPTNQLPGSLAREGTITIAAPPLGEVEVKLADLAAIRGGAGLGRPARFYLRDGRVLAGVKTKGALLWSAPTAVGGKAPEPQELDPAEFHVLLLATEARDGTPAEKATHFVELANGTVLAVAAKAEAILDWVAPWGRDPRPWSATVEAVRRALPTPHYRLMTKEGSFFAASLAQTSIALTTTDGRELEVTAASIERLWTAGESLRSPAVTASDWLDFAELPVGFGPSTGVLLAGDQLLAGDLASVTLPLRDGATVLRLETARIRSIRRSPDPETSHLLSVETDSGERVTGSPLDAYLLLKSPGGTIEIPTTRLLGFRRGAPQP